LEPKYDGNVTRAQAEAAVRKKFGSLENSAVLPAEDTRALLHELRVHQVQLEMQNEELRNAHLAIEESRARYVDLYNFSPVGYCSIADNGAIVEANLTLSTLLGVSRVALIGKPFTRFIFSADQDSFYLFQKQILTEQEPSSQTAEPSHGIELRLSASDGNTFWVKLVAAQALNPGIQQLRVVVTDIGARKQVEIDLASSERRLRAIIETEPDCVKLTNADGCLLEMNAAGLRLVEADSFQQIENGSVYSLVDEAHRDAFRALSARVFQGESGFLEFQITGLKGTRRWVETHASPLRDDAGKISASLGITRDITARKSAESSLRLSDIALKNVSQGVLMTDADQSIVWTNAAFSAITGHTSAEVMGWNCRFQQGPETDPLTVTAIRLALKNHVEFNGEILNYRKDGTAYWNDLTITPVLDAPGVVSHYVGIIRDVTARKLAEAALRLSDTALKNISQGVLITGADHRIVSANAAFKAITGYSDGEAIGQNCNFLQGPETDQLMVMDIRLKLKNFVEFNGEILNYRKNGTAYWNEMTITPVSDARGVVSHYVGIIRDVTERRLIEKANQETTMQLKLVIRGGDIGFWDWDVPSNGLTVNDRWLTMLGLDPNGPPPGMDLWNSLVHPSDMHKLAKLLASVMFNPDGVSGEAEIRARHSAGHYVWLLDRFNVVERDAHGQPLRVVGTHLEITERKHAEAEIENQLLELQRWQEVLLGREDRVLGLKREVNELLVRQNQPLRYASPEVP